MNTLFEHKTTKMTLIGIISLIIAAYGGDKLGIKPELIIKVCDDILYLTGGFMGLQKTFDIVDKIKSKKE